MRRVGIGVVGLGDQGPRYARLVAAHPQAELVVTCSRTADRALQIAERCRAHRWTTDYRDLVQDSDVSGVIIATEVERHADIAMAALEAGKHVLVEKPLTATPCLEEADRVLTLAEERDRILMLAWVERYDARCAKVKERIDTGDLGKIVSVFIRRNYQRRYFERPRFQKHPWIWEPGVHSIDLLLWFVGRPAMQVFACGGEVADTGYLDTFWATVRFDNGAVGVIEQVASTIPDGAAPCGDREIEVIGTKGTTRWFEPSDSLLFWGPNHTEYPDTHWYLDVAGMPAGALYRQLSAFVRCVQRNEKPRWGTPQEIRAVTTVGHAILESLRISRGVRVEPT